MRLLILSLLTFTLGYGERSFNTCPMASDSIVLFDFKDTEEAYWQVVNDGVMGGRSEGYVAIEDGLLKFTGTLVTRGGGFTSVRANKVVNLEGYDGLELRVRGSGRTFEVYVDDDTRRGWRRVSRRAPFQTSKEWSSVRIPFSALKTTIFGRSINAPPTDLANIKRIGVFIVDGKDGPFELEVDTIHAYRETSD